MDASKEDQLSERSQRLFDRNAVKDRFTSTSDEPMEDRDRLLGEEREGDYITTAGKPSQTGSMPVFSTKCNSVCYSAAVMCEGM